MARNITQFSLEDRTMGVLLGVMAGDVLGIPVEGCKNFIKFLCFKIEKPFHFQGCLGHKNYMNSIFKFSRTFLWELSW